MATTTFVSGTLITSEWLNEVDALLWDLFQGADTAAEARTALGLGTMAVQNKTAVDITGGTIVGITDLAVADGGTGASTAAGARTNLELGTISTQSAASVAITGGTITGITDLVVADGGTGRSSLTQDNLIVGAGTNAVTFIAPGTSGNVLQSNGTVWASATLAVATAASQAEMETGSSTSVAVTPGRLKYSPSAAKAWATWSSDGTLYADHNVDSITDNDVGDFTVVFTTDFSDALYASILSISDTNPPRIIGFTNKLAGSVDVISRDATTGVMADSSGRYNIACFGDI
jgi:hypothetical protein